jgi:hypothetical protein
VLCALFTFDFIFARNSFAGLISYRAAGFTRRLAGASAFAASGYFLFSGFRNRLNHKRPPDYLEISCTYYNTLSHKLQALFSTFFAFSRR